MATPPAYACYLLFQLSPGQPIWVQVGDPGAGTNSSCVLGLQPPSGPALRVAVVVNGGTVGQGVAIVVMY
jgi:hypothetical protein